MAQVRARKEFAMDTDVDTPSSAYEAKRAAKVDRLRSRAAAKRRERSALHKGIDRLGEVMNGQPVLVGHHSERRHRRDLEKMNRNMRKACDLEREAQSLERRADAAESSTAVHSDDPEAVRKIREKIAAKEAFREQCKAVNAKIREAKRKAKKTGEPWEPVAKELLVEQLGLSPATADAAMAPDFGNRHGVPSYVLTNCGAEIRRLKKRLVELEAASKREGREEEIGDIRIVEEENRVRMFFAGKPPEGIRSDLKRSGFRWARSISAWQRHASEAAWHHARRIATAASA